jgi:hypothetical protein
VKNNNGEPYMGKPYENGSDCAGTDPIHSRILYVDANKAYLSKDNCQVIDPPRPLSLGTFHLDAANPALLEYNGLTYTAAVQAGFVQKAEAIQSTTPSLAINFSSPSASGDLLVCFANYDQSGGAVVTRVTDSSGDVFVRALGPTSGGGHSASRQSEAWYAENIAGGASVSATMTLSSPANSILVCTEFSGVAPSGSLDSAVSSSSLAPPGSTATIGPVTTTSSGDLLVSALWQSQTPPSPGPGYNLISNFSNDIYMYGGAAGPSNYTATVNGVDDWLGFLLAFKVK